MSLLWLGQLSLVIAVLAALWRLYRDHKSMVRQLRHALTDPITDTPAAIDGVGADGELLHAGAALTIIEDETSPVAPRPRRV